MLISILISIILNLYGPQIAIFLFGYYDRFQWAILSAILPELLRRVSLFLISYFSSLLELQLKGKKINRSARLDIKKITYLGSWGSKKTLELPILNGVALALRFS